MAEPLLAVSGLQSGYGASVVLDEIGFVIEAGRSLALLGRNGTGKTTLLVTLMGHLRARQGRISWQGGDITSVKPYQRVGLGLGWVPQERECFSSLTVEEHMSIAARPGPWTPARVFEFFPNLANRRNNRGNALSGGEQQMVAIGRALVTNPRLLLLDEPLEGLAPVIVEEIAATIRTLVEREGMTVILVEQHPQFALELCADAIVLDRGRIVHASTSAALQGDHEELDRLVGMRRFDK